jgi:hypothetical protein
MTITIGRCVLPDPRDVSSSGGVVSMGGLAYSTATLVADRAVVDHGPLAELLDARRALVEQREHLSAPAPEDLHRQGGLLRGVAYGRDLAGDLGEERPTILEFAARVANVDAERLPACGCR